MMKKSGPREENRPELQPRVYLKEWRMLHGLSQTEIAKKMEVSKSEVSRLEGSKRKVSVAWLERFSSALGITREQLFTPPGVTVLRREQVMEVGSQDHGAPTPAPAQAPARAGIGPWGLSCAEPFMFVMASEGEYLLIDKSKGSVVGKLSRA